MPGSYIQGLISRKKGFLKVVLCELAIPVYSMKHFGHTLSNSPACHLTIGTSSDTVANNEKRFVVGWLIAVRIAAVFLIATLA